MTYRALIACISAMAFILSDASADTLSRLAGEYRVTPSSQVSFSVKQIVGEGFSGRFLQFSGRFDLHPDQPATSSVTFSLHPDSVATGEPRVENFLRSDAVFDAANFPEIRFRSTNIIPTGPDSATIEGILSARGRQHEETFRATLIEHDGRRVAFRVIGEVSRSPYGMDVGTPIYSNVVEFDMLIRGEQV